jgi:hypothetical protein
VSDRPTFKLLLEAQPADVPVNRRLAGVLKRLLRSYGFKCLSAEEIPVTRDRAGGAGGTIGAVTHVQQ